MPSVRRVLLGSVVAGAMSLQATNVRAEESSTTADRKFDVGADLAYLFPVGAYADQAGLSVGPILQADRRIAPSFELTLRTGFLLGVAEGSGHVVSGRHLEKPMSIVPVWTGVRYFFSEPHAGVYGAGELGLNVLLPRGNEMRLRIGANAALGYVLSETLPFDFRVQLSVLNLFEDIPRDSGTERTYVGIAASVGYTIRL